jgi:hypothetical protein
LASEGQVWGSIRAGRPGHWHLSLEIAEHTPPSPAAGRSRRELEAEVCDELADAAAVAILMALGGSNTAASPEPLSAPSAAPLDTLPPNASPPDALPVDRAPSAANAPPEPSGVQLGFVPSVELVMDSASVAGPALGVAAQAQLRWEAFGLGAYGLWLPERSEPLGARQDVGFSLMAAGLRGCYRSRDAQPSIDLCGGFELGRLEAEGLGLRGARSRTDTWLAPSWGAAVGWRLFGGVSIQARLEALLPLGRERYVVDGDVLVHEVPDAALRAGLVASWALGGNPAPNAVP